ncbi:MAG TPA: hypothetical protein VH475_26970 [Tepidisphaeraceae bacterium]
MDREEGVDIGLWERCANEDQLYAWVQNFLQLRMPRRGVCAGHQSPFEYLKHAYFEPGKDVVVWAPRGGGKTRLGAAATLLDLLHKPGVCVRILGGSLEQSLRMWEHLLPDITIYCKDKIDGKLGARRFRLVNGSSAGVVTQSQRAVRGLRVQKLRCDEVEMFDRRVWEAAQLITKTRPADAKTGEPAISGVVEAFSTLHRPGGLMESIVDNAKETGVRVIRWCVLEVLQKCPRERDCAACPLDEDCHGIAKKDCDGFLSIDDAIAMKRRVSRETWEAEMLCRRPSRTGRVFGTFDVDVHVREELPAADAGSPQIDPKAEGMYLGIDFGFRNPFVCLWIWRDRHGRSIVIDEYVQSEVDLAGHIEAIRARPHGGAVRVTCDPAGCARNEQTGTSNVQRLRDAGFKVACRASRIPDGLEMIRAGLRSGTGQVSLFIHPRCKQLILAMRTYHYGDRDRAEVPAKDGPDHLVDALRYYFVSRDAGEGKVGWY